MSEHPLICLHESDWGEVKTTMKNICESFSKIEKKICDHINEAEREGGVRDKVTKLTWEVSELKKRFWWSALIGGIIGALIGSGSNDAIALIIKVLFKVV